MAFCQDQKRGKYLLIIHEKARSNYNKLLDYIGDDDIAGKMAGSYEKDGLFDDGENGFGDNDIYSDIGLEQRGALHFEEACDLINALTRDRENRKNFDLILNIRTAGNDGFDRFVQHEVRMNRVQMIERLEWISSMDFGDNVDEWEEWRQIRLEEGFFTAR